MPEPGQLDVQITLIEKLQKWNLNPKISKCFSMLS